MATDFSQLSKLFQQYTLSMTQAQMQAYLSLVYQQANLKKVLAELFAWEMHVGYLTEKKLSSNEDYCYQDEELAVTFEAQVNFARSGYTPKPLAKHLHCPICIDNVGIPGKEDLRVFQFELTPGREFFAQGTPFPIYPRHFVLIDVKKNPMRMDRYSVRDLLAFIAKAPGYVGCSNSDVAWAGASVLQHHHYQVIDQLKLPVMQAGTYQDLVVEKDGAKIEILNYPLSVFRVTAATKEQLIQQAGDIIESWKALDPGKNTCNLLVKQQDALFQCYILLRNPDYRTPPELTVIKSEGVGILEVSGAGIYPVPGGDQADWAWDQIRNHGLDVIKGIVSGNSPLQPGQYSQVFNTLVGDSPSEKSSR